MIGSILPWIGVLAAFLALLYLAAPTLANVLLFHPSTGALNSPPPLAGAAGEVVDDEAADGIRLRHWWYEADPNAPIVILFQGNAGHLGHRDFLAQGLIERGLSVLLVGYRGYGASEGRPTEEGLHRDADAAIRWTAERTGRSQDIVLLGRSLGAAVAAQAAIRHDIAGLVLDSGFTSLADAARAVYPILPRFVLNRITNRFGTLAALERFEGPVLVIHGTEDEIIPFRMGEALYAAARPPKEWYPVPGARHNDLLLVAEDEYFDVVEDFARRAAKSDAAGGEPPPPIFP